MWGRQSQILPGTWAHWDPGSLLWGTVLAGGRRAQPA